jgi:hypothetical protein
MMCRSKIQAKIRINPERDILQKIFSETEPLSPLAFIEFTNFKLQNCYEMDFILDLKYEKKLMLHLIFPL